MKISITVADATPAEAARILDALAAMPQIRDREFPATGAAPAFTVVPPIAEADRPDAGVTYPSGAPDGPSAEAAFGGTLSPEAAFAGNASDPAASNIPAGPAPTATGAAGIPPVPPAASPVSVGPGGVPLDKTGLPWDARIHAKSSNGPGGTINADGTWRAKRGLNDAAFVARVEAELRGAQAAPAPVTQATVPPVPTVAAAVPPVPTVAPAPSATPAPVAVPVPPVAVPPVPAAGGSLPVTGDYIQLVTAITGWIPAGKLTEAEVTGACAAVGVPSLPVLATRLDLVASVSAALNAIVGPRL